MTDMLSKEEIDILKYVDYNVYIDRAKAFRLFSTTSDYSINQLLKRELLKSIPPTVPNELIWFSLTPAGQSFINNYKLNTGSTRRIHILKENRNFIIVRQHHLCYRANNIALITDATLITIAAADTKMDWRHLFLTFLTSFSNDSSATLLTSRITD